MPPFIHFLYCFLFLQSVKGSLEPILVHKAGNPWTGAKPSKGTIAHTFTHPFTHYQCQLDMPISKHCMALDWGPKPEYPEKTPEIQGEHANSMSPDGSVYLCGTDAKFSCFCSAFCFLMLCSLCNQVSPVLQVHISLCLLTCTLLHTALLCLPCGSQTQCLTSMQPTRVCALD